MSASWRLKQCSRRLCGQISKSEPAHHRSTKRLPAKYFTRIRYVHRVVEYMNALQLFYSYTICVPSRWIYERGPTILLVYVMFTEIAVQLFNSYTLCAPRLRSNNFTRIRYVQRVVEYTIAVQQFYSYTLCAQSRWIYERGPTILLVYVMCTEL